MSSRGTKLTDLLKKHKNPKISTSVSEKQSKKNKKLSEVFKACAVNHADDRKLRLQTLCNKWGSIVSFMHTSISGINVCRRKLNDFPEAEPTEQKAIQAEAKNIFTEFRAVLEDKPPTTQVNQEVCVFTEDIDGVTVMLEYMRKESGAGRQSSGAGANRIAFAKLFREGIEIIKLGELPNNWPSDDEVTRDGAMLLSPFKRMLVSAFSNDKNEPNTAYVTETLDFLQKEIDQKDGRQGILEALRGEITKVEKYRAQLQTVRGSDVERRAQDANLDRVFHLCYVMWKSGITNADELMTFAKVMSALVSETVEEQKFVETVKGAFNKHLRALARNIDGIGKGGDRTNHKYQHPLMVTVKRFLNGLTTITSCPFIGQLLNELRPDSAASMKIMLAYFKMDMELSERAVERNSTWILHQYLKGNCDTWVWTGLVKGSALTVTIKGVGLGSAAVVYGNAKEILNFSSMTSAQMGQKMRRRQTYVMKKVPMEDSHQLTPWNA